jgi:effector-binding domain-containing protein
MTYTVQRVETESRLIAAVRLTATIPELPRVIPDACGEVWRFIRAHNIPQPGRHVAVYLDEVINIECGAEVGASFTGDGRVVCSRTPAGPAVMTVHRGPYHLLPEAHEAVRAWCSDHNVRLAGPNWEVYGHWTDDPSQLETDVYYLIAGS